MTHYSIYGRTECGRGYEANEDHILLGRFVKNRGGMLLRISGDDDFLTSYGMLLAVADGIGGVQGGGAASRLGLDTFHTQYYSSTRDTDALACMLEALRAAGERANQTLLKVAANKPEWSGMGCALAGVCLGASGYLVFHAGDSRVYRFRNGALKQLTTDDSLVAIALEAGYMTHQEAHASPMRNTITNCVGSRSFKLSVDEEPLMRANDVLLICSDGLHGALDHERCERLIADNGGAEQIGDRLVDEALKAGGHDDISTVVLLAI